MKGMGIGRQLIAPRGREQAAACGELDTGKDPAIQAKLLINNIYGLRVYAKLQPNGPAMREMVDDLLSSLKSHPNG